MTECRKLCSIDEAVGKIRCGDWIMVSGFGNSGVPDRMIEALADSGLKHLTFITCGFGAGPGIGLGRILRNGQVDRIIGTHFNRNPEVITYSVSGKIQLTLLPLGTLIESIRAGGAGIPAYYTPVGVGTDLCKGKEIREFHGRKYVLEEALHADVALICANEADTLGNLVYYKTAKNFNPAMATAADTVIAEVKKLVPAGALDPELVFTPHIYVDCMVMRNDETD